MTEIYCYANGGGYFELYPDTIIAQSLKANDIGDLTSINFNFTDTITIPSSPVNDALLGYSNDEKSTSTLMYTKVPVRIEIGGIQTVPIGIAIIKVVQAGYSLAVVSGAKTFFDTVNTKLLTDLSGLLLESSQGIVASKRNATSGIVYPVSIFKTITSPEFDIKPFIYYSTLIDRIITDAGYTKAGSIFSDTKYLKKICSCWGTAKGYQDSFVKERIVQAYVNAPQNIAIADNGVLHPINFSAALNEGLGNNPIGYWNGTKYIVNEPGVTANYFMFACNVKVEVTIFVPPGYTVDLLVVNANNIGVDNIATNVGSGTYTYDFIKQRTSVTGFSIDPPIALNGTGNGIGIAVIYNSPAAGSTSIDVLTGRIEVTPLELPLSTNDSLGIHSMNYYAKLLPELLQTDLLRDFAVNYGILFTEKDKVLTCTTMNEVITSGTIVDWTDKREPSIKDSIDPTLTSYAQLNKFNYQARDGYVNNKLGEGGFAIANVNLQTQKTVYESIFDASMQAEAITVSLTSMFTPTDADYFGIYPKVNGAADVFKLALVRSKYSGESNITYPNGASYSDYFIAYFIDPQQGDTLDFDQDILQFYGSFITSIQKLRVINRVYNLTVEDIAAYSALNRIHDNGALYRVNLISNFIKGKSTNVQLIKIV
jgi:hypothetical protein